MFLCYFSEMPNSSYPEDEALRRHPDDHPARDPGDTVLLLSNKYFYRLAEAVGFDGVMTNEHHTAPFCMQTRCNITSAVAAAITDRVKILQLGNPLPLWENPVQLAEEIAMLDLISGGRIIAGMVRGGGTEQLANNFNPVFNRDRFVEAHDLIVKTWTQPGPFRWEGDNYQVRVVNPWVLPLQQPHPRIWVPGVTSKESIVFAAEHGYPYVCLSTTLEKTKQIWELYDQVAQQVGFTAGPEHRGYLMRCHVADDEETARRNAREFTWMQGEFTGVGKSVWTAPTAYSTWEARQARVQHARYQDSFDLQVANGTIIYGTPDQVIVKIRRWLQETRPGMLMLWGSDGHVSQRDSMRCVELLGTAVLPAVREIGAELGLLDPFECHAPVSVASPQPV